MYELIILSLLMRFPMHGYLIAKIANDTLDHTYCRLPGQNALDLNSKLRQTNGLAHQINTALRREIFRPLSLLRRIKRTEYPEILVIDCHKDALHLRVLDETLS